MPMQPPVRIPLVWEPTPNTQFHETTAVRVNVMDEKMGSELYCLKRPGISPLDFGYPSSSPGQGFVRWKNSYVAIINDDLWWAPPPVIYADVLSGTTTLTGAPWRARAGHASCVYNGRMYIAGGTNAAGDVADIWSTDNPAGGGRWRQDNASAPWGWRVGAQMVVHNNRMYFMGGRNPNTGVEAHDVWSSTDGVEWKEETPAAAWNGRANFAIVSYGGSMILTGGSETGGTNFDDVWSSSDGAAWTRVATGSWGMRYGHAMCVLNNRLILCGGIVGGVFMNDSYYSLDSGVTWTLGNGAPWSFGRALMGYTVYRGLMWTIAGNTAPAAYTSHVWTTPDGITWTFQGTIWGAIGSAQAVVFPSPSSDPNPNVPTIWMTGGVNGAWFNNAEYMIPAVVAPNPMALTPDAAGLSYQMLSFQNGARLVVKNATNMWFVNDTTPTKITDLGYPVETVPGVVALGGFLFVMDRSGLIYNCELDNMEKWPSLNVIGADFTDDEGVYLGRYKNYIVALGQYTTQLFLDAGLSFGSPLRPYLNANTEIGCYHASTVAQYADILVWVSQTRDGFKQVVALNGGRPEAISTTAVEKSLAQIAVDDYGYPFQACIMSIPGHVFYILPCVCFGALGPATLFTWVYDFTTKEWYQWHSTAVGTSFLFAAADAERALDIENGTVWRLTPDARWDGANEDITSLWRTVPVDAGTMRKKFWGRTDLVGDQATNAGVPVVFNIRYSDDMGATYTIPRQFDLATKRPALFRNGSSEKRIFEMYTTARFRFRVQAIETQIEVEPM